MSSSPTLNGTVAGPSPTGFRVSWTAIAPIAGGAAALLFGIALLASGQSSTLTGTIAGQVIMDGFLHMKIPCYQRRLITRGLALVPALIGVLWLGDGSIGRLLVWSQVLLSLQLPFAMWPLIRSVSDPRVMGDHTIGKPTQGFAWVLFAVITGVNLLLISGPSKTADIEQVLAYGVHGPKRLLVILTEQ